VILNRMFFITEMKYVSCAVRNQTSCTIHVSFRHLTAESWDRSQARHVRHVVDNVALGQISSKYFGFSLQVFYQCFIHTLAIRYSYKDKRTKHGNLPKQCSFGKRGALDRNVLSVFSSLHRLVENFISPPRFCMSTTDQCL
jgi:hypothetical protein